MTVKLYNGLTVLAKMYHGEPSAVTYSNRTQAYTKQAALGPNWSVRRFGRPFYVVYDEVHPC